MLIEYVDILKFQRCFNGKMEPMTVQDDGLVARFDVWLAGSIMVSASMAMLVLWMGSVESLSEDHATKVRPQSLP